MRYLRATRAARAVVAAAMLLAAAAAPAAAHILPAHTGTLNVRGRQAFVALSLPASLFPEADDDRDGRLSRDEVARHAELLQRLVATTVHLADGDVAAQLQFARVGIEHGDGSDASASAGPASHVLVLVIGAFPSEPATVSLRVDRLDRAGDTARLLVRAGRGGATEAATLRADHATHRFFAPAWTRAADGARVGFAHILTGTDHLLFLLTLVLAGTGWRYWTGTITSFTAGHAVVLGLAATGRAPGVDPAMTEVLIAASIVLMAVRALRRDRAAAPRALGREAMFAAACGLVHGLGVAGAVRALDVDGRADLLTLGAFNVGVELGQLTVVLLCLAALRGVAGMAARAETQGWSRLDRLAPRVLAGAAGVMGAIWFALRLPLAG